MKNFVLILLVIGLFGCNETKKKKTTESLLPGFQVDSMQIYYTTDWLTNKVIDTLSAADSTKKQFFLINRPSRNFDDISFIKTKLPNTITITDSILINKLKNCFSYVDPGKTMRVADCGLPIYRDFIVLYANGKKTAQIKICFSCNYISIYPEEFYKHVNINDTTINRLQKYFNSNIHKIKRF